MSEQTERVSVIDSLHQFVAFAFEGVDMDSAAAEVHSEITRRRPRRDVYETHYIAPRYGMSAWRTLAEMLFEMVADPQVENGLRVWLDKIERGYRQTGIAPVDAGRLACRWLLEQIATITPWARQTYKHHEV